MQRNYLVFSVVGVLTILFCCYEIKTEQIYWWPSAFALFLFWLYGFFLCCFGWIKYKDIELLPWLFDRPVRFFWLAVLIAIALIGYFDLYYLFFPSDELDFKEWDNILVESHGLLFDILLFGIGITIYDEIRGKRVRKERYLEELDDYRGWKDTEAAFRVAGLVKRLELEGENDISFTNLHIGRLPLEVRSQCISSHVEYASLSDAEFMGLNLSGFNFRARVPSHRMNLRKCTLDNTKFLHADMNESYLSGAKGTKTDFRHASMNGVQLGGTRFISSLYDSAVLRDALLNDATFTNCTFRTADLSGASMIRTKFVRACTFTNATLDGAIIDQNSWEKYLAVDAFIRTKYKLIDGPFPDVDGGPDDYFVIGRIPKPLTININR